MDYETGGTTVDWLSGALWIVAALGLVALFILVNSHRVPRAEPDVTAQVEAHFAVGKAPEIAGTSMGFPRALVIIRVGCSISLPGGNASDSRRLGGFILPHRSPQQGQSKASHSPSGSLQI